MVSLAMHDKGPVKLAPFDGSHVHSAGVPLHEHGSQRHRLSNQTASDEFQTKPRVLRLERNLGGETPLADRAVHDAAHRIGATGKSERKIDDVLDRPRHAGSRAARAGEKPEAATST